MSRKIDSTQLAKLSARLERRGANLTTKFPKKEDYASLYACLSDLGYHRFAALDDYSAGPRVSPPDYKALGINRKAGAPSEQDIELYRQVTAGGELTKDGFVCPVILTDNDLITDRYKVHSFRSITSLATKYLGRSNDNNHSLDVTEAAGRLIDIFIGTDSATEMHEHYPSTALKVIDPLNPYEGAYSAVCGLMAFPAESQSTINKLKTGLVQDVSIAFRSDSVVCSLCLKPMESFFWFNYCEEHGFPGEINEATGQPVVGIFTTCSDVRTFGHVSDGAAKRARYVLDYTANP